MPSVKWGVRRFLDSDLGFYTTVIIVIAAFIVGYWIGGLHAPITPE